MAGIVIHALPVGGGILALCPMPGRDGAYADDIEHIREWRPALVITLVTAAEMAAQNAVPLGGTTLFRLYQVGDALAWQAHLARAHIWSRVFPYAGNWLRLGLPAPKAWPRVSAAIASATAKDVR